MVNEGDDMASHSVTRLSSVGESITGGSAAYAAQFRAEGAGEDELL